MTVASNGTGPITLGTAATIGGVLYLAFATAGAVNGETIAYSISDIGQSEQGTAVYSSVGPTITRSPVTSTNGNAPINVTNAAIVRISPARADIANLRENNVFTANQSIGGTLAVTGLSTLTAGFAAGATSGISNLTPASTVSPILALTSVYGNGTSVPTIDWIVNQSGIPSGRIGLAVNGVNANLVFYTSPDFTTTAGIERLRIAGAGLTGGTLILGGLPFAVGSSTYNIIQSPDGVNAVQVGAAQDKSNYYANDRHVFFNRAGITLATIDTASLSLSQTTASSSTATGALIVAGGAGVAGALNVGGIFQATGNAGVGGNLTVLGLNSTFGSGGTGNTVASVVINGGSGVAGAGAVIPFRKNSLNVWTIGHRSALTGGALNDFTFYNWALGGHAMILASADSSLSLLSTTASTSPTTGALTVPNGGVGIGGGLNNTSATKTANILSVSNLADTLPANWGYASILGNVNGFYPSTTDFRAKVRASVAGVGTFQHTGDNSYMIAGIYGWVPTGGHGALAVAGMFDRPGGEGRTPGNPWAVMMAGGTPGSPFTYRAITLYDFTTNTEQFYVTPDGDVRSASTAASTSVTTGALTVAGGVGVAGDLNVGGTIFARASNGLSVAIGPGGAIRDLTNGSGIMFFDVSAGGATNGSFMWRGTSSFTQYMLLSNAGLSIPATTASTSTTTGALTVAGGVGIGGAFFSGSNIQSGAAILTGTSSASYSYVRGNNAATYPLIAASGLAMGWNFSGGGGEATFWNTYTSVVSAAFQWRQLTGASASTILMGLTKDGVLSLPATTASTTPITGALTVAGGLGVGGAVNVAANVVSTGGVFAAAAKGNLFGTAGGTAASGVVTPADANLWLYNFSSTNWAGFGADANGNVWLKAGVSGTPVPALWLNAGDQSGRFTATVASTSTTTGALTVAGGVGLAGALNVGAGGSIAGGFTVTSFNNGTGAGTVTPNPTNGNYEYITNNAAFTLAAPAADCAIDLMITNGASAGSVTFSGYQVSSLGNGDPLNTVNGQIACISIRRVNGVSWFTVKRIN
jgi:hypothetical protein